MKSLCRPRSTFFNRLYEKHVSEEQYKYAEGVCETLKYNTMLPHY